MPEFDYCYCPLCREIFKQKFGYDPLEAKDPSEDHVWHQFRLDQLVKVVQEIAKAIHVRDSIITAAVFPTPEMSRKMVRQVKEAGGQVFGLMALTRKYLALNIFDIPNFLRISMNLSQALSFM